MYTACMDKSEPQNTTPDACFSIQQVSERTGLSAYTLRYYEQVGLISPIGRDAGGRRRYTTEDVAWIALLILGRDTGMPLAQIQQFNALLRQGASTGPQRLALMEAHRAHVQAEMDALCANLKMIDQKIAMMRRAESDPSEYAGWQERCLDMLQKRSASRAQSDEADTDDTAQPQAAKRKQR